jgi:hypothetical protein
LYHDSVSELHIGRVPFDRATIEANLKTWSKLVPIKVGHAKEDAADLPDLVSAVTKAAFLTAALEPESANVPTLFRDAAQCGAAVFALARAGNNAVDLPLAADTATRLRGPVPRDILTPTVWLTAAWCAMATNDFASLMNLCYTPSSLLRESPLKGDEFAYLYVDAIRSFWTSDPETGHVLLAALRATDPALIHRGDVDYVIGVDVPSLDLLYAIVQKDETRFQGALIKVLEGHKEYWSPANRRNDIYSLVALSATAFAALGIDRGMRPAVSSDYMPARLLAVHSAVVPLVCCPYCLIPIAAETEVCPGCLQDVSKDAPVDMDSRAFVQSPVKTCASCKSHILEMAVRCPVCRATS